MDGMIFGRTSLLCTLLLWAFQVCTGGVVVEVGGPVEVMKGETAKLHCKYTGSDSPKTIVEWFIEDQGTRTRVAYRSKSGEEKSDDGTPLTGRVTIGEDFTLTITDVKPSDELSFNCQVTAGAQGVGDGSTMLKVFFAPEKPELTKPSTQSISVGESFSSEIGTCETKNGHPPPRIVWFKNDNPIPEDKDKSKETYMISSVVKEASGLYTITSRLLMRPTKSEKDSVFHCVVEYSMPKTGINQKKSNTIKINLNYPSERATFTLLNTQPIKEGDTVEMKCETDGNPQPEFEFYKNDNVMDDQGDLLTLKNVKRADSAVYLCKALDFDNMEADLTGTINLTVNYIDRVSITPEEPQIVKLEEQVEWQCGVKASGTAAVQWKKGSEVLSQSSSLSIQKVAFKDAGEYVCVGSVPSVPGLTAERSVNLTVEGKPEILTPAPGEVGKEGEMVTLKCSAYGFPAPQFTWKPSGKESVSVEDNMVVSTVTLQATADIMKSGVTCEVFNKHGKESKIFPVSLKRAIDNSAEADKQQGGSSGVVVAVVVCVLLLLLLVALIYFLSKKNNLPCSKKDKKEVTTTDRTDNIVVEMKTDKANEEAGLLNKKVPAEKVSDETRPWK